MDETLLLRFKTDVAPLPPPVIPLALDGGLGYDDVLAHPDKSVLAQVGPWDGFEDGDTLQVLRLSDGRVLGTASASAADKFRGVDVWIGGKVLASLGDGTHRLASRVVNLIGSPVTSIESGIRIKLDKPGGLDTDPTTPYLNENLKPPAIEPTVIDVDTPSAAVTLAPYDNMAEGDLVVLRWGRQGNDLVKGPLVAGEVGLPVIFAVSRDIIDKGGTGNALNVNYQVYDVVANWSLWSPRALVDVVDPAAPPAPAIQEAENGVLDIGTLSGDTVTAIIETGLQKGDRCVLFVAGTNAAGDAVTYQSDEFVAQRAFAIEDIDAAPFVAMVQSTCQVWYTRQRAEETLVSSRLMLVVAGRTVPLAAPVVLEAVGATIDPSLVTSGAHVRIDDHALIVPGTTVDYAMHGTTAGGGIVVDEQSRDISSGTPRPLTFVTAADRIAALAGGSATFSYTVVTYDAAATTAANRARTSPFAAEIGASLPSPSRTYHVLGDVPPTLPAPTLPEAHGDRIDPADIDDTVGVQVDVAYPAMAAGDAITLKWDGSSSGRYVDTLIYRGGSLSFYVPKASQLVPNLLGTIDVGYEVRRGNTVQRSQQGLFDVGAGGAAFPAPTIDEAPDGSLKPFDARDGIAVRVPASVVFQPGDVVTATFGGFSTQSKPGAGNLAFDVPAGEVAMHLGHTVEVTYAVTRMGTTVASSPLSLEVGRFEEQDASLPTPGLRQANGRLLDLGTFEGEPEAVVAPWPLIAAGQRVWIGIQMPTDHALLYIRQGQPVTGAEVTSGLKQTGDLRRHLDAATDGIKLILRCRITFDGRPSEQDAVTFPLQSYILSLDDKKPLALAGPSSMRVGQSAAYSASGGKTPYVYASGTPFVASIDPHTGICNALLAGKTTLSVTDAAGTSATFPLVVSEAAPPWSETFDFDDSPKENVSSYQVGAQLNYSVFDWFFDRHALPSREQFIGVKAVGDPIPDMTSGRVLRIGNDYDDTLVTKSVLCHFRRAWSRVRFAVTSIDDPVTVDFYEDRGGSFDGSWPSLGRIVLPASPQNQEVRFDAPDDSKIKWLRIQCVDTIHLDFFKMKN